MDVHFTTFKLFKLISGHLITTVPTLHFKWTTAEHAQNHIPNSTCQHDHTEHAQKSTQSYSIIFQIPYMMAKSAPSTPPTKIDSRASTFHTEKRLVKLRVETCVAQSAYQIRS